MPRPPAIMEASPQGVKRSCEGTDCRGCECSGSFRLARLLPAEVYGVDYANYSGVDGRVRPSNRGHGREAFGGKQNAFANAGTNGVQRQNGIAAVRAVQLQ